MRVRLPSRGDCIARLNSRCAASSAGTIGTPNARAPAASSRLPLFIVAYCVAAALRVRLLRGRALCVLGRLMRPARFVELAAVRVISSNSPFRCVCVTRPSGSVVFYRFWMSYSCATVRPPGQLNVDREVVFVGPREAVHFTARRPGAR